MKTIIVIIMFAFISGNSFYSLAKNQDKYILSVGTTAPIISFSAATIDGYGFNIESNKFNLSYFKISHHSRQPSGLLGLPSSWVRTRSGDFLELSCKFVELYGIHFGYGINNLILEDENDLGICLFGEKKIFNLVSVKINYRSIRDVRMLSVNFGVNLLEAIQRFKEQHFTSIQ